jgi:cell division protein FtsL
MNTRDENILYGILCTATLAVIISMIILDLSRL